MHASATGSCASAVVPLKLAHVSVPPKHTTGIFKPDATSRKRARALALDCDDDVVVVAARHFVAPASFSQVCPLLPLGFTLQRRAARARSVVSRWTTTCSTLGAEHIRNFVHILSAVRLSKKQHVRVSVSERGLTFVSLDDLKSLQAQAIPRRGVPRLPRQPERRHRHP